MLKEHRLQVIMVRCHDDTAAGDEADGEDWLSIRNEAVHLFPGQSAVGGGYLTLQSPPTGAR